MTNYRPGCRGKRCTSPNWPRITYFYEDGLGVDLHEVVGPQIDERLHATYPHCSDNTC